MSARLAGVVTVVIPPVTPVMAVCAAWEDMRRVSCARRCAKVRRGVRGSVVTEAKKRGLAESTVRQKQKKNDKKNDELTDCGTTGGTHESPERCLT